jgi:twinkle protein
MMDFSQYGIKIPAGSKGNVKAICPNCTPHDRKPKNRNSKDLSVNIEEGVWNCHNCSWSGFIPKGKPKKEYVKPVERLEKLQVKYIDWFENKRGISNNTLLRFNVTEALEWMPQHNKEVNCICFNYYRNGELVNIKFRGPQKSFKMAKDAELIFYNLDALKDETTAVIVEGEIDCLTMYECGIFNTVSVPNGASKGSQKLEYLDNCWQSFERMDKVIIAVDNDEAGNSLKEELARRIGKNKCYTVAYPEGCKDANEVLLQFGKEAVKGLVTDAAMWPLEGFIQMDEMYDEVCDFFINGYPKGAAARIPRPEQIGEIQRDGFDDLLTFYPGQLTMVTGSPGSGKDEFLNYIAANLAKHEGWNFGVCGMEEPAVYSVTKIQEKLVGKSFAFRKDESHRISTPEFEWSIAMIDRHFHFINVNKVSVIMTDILEKFSELVKRYGINAIIINPWNCLEHNRPENKSETEYISEALGELITWLVTHRVHGFLVAHPTKLQKRKDTGKYEVATMYSISGSANFFNKTHNGISVYRDFDTNVVDVYVQKVKWSWLGKIGFVSYEFDTNTRQYKPI